MFFYCSPWLGAFSSFIAAVMLSCSPGIFGDSKLKTVRALAGESVILPCYTDFIDYTTTVEWSKEGMAQHVLVFRQGFEIHEEKHPVFWYRSSLIMNEWRHGNISVRISDVKLSDAGKYTCKTIHKNIQRSIVLDLIVGAVSEPKLSVVPSMDAGLTLQCEVQCWFPKPVITLLDDAGKEVSAHDEKTEFRPEGCFSVTRRVTLQTATNSVTCIVDEGFLNQRRVEKFIMPGVFRTSCTKSTILTALSTLIVCGLTLFLGALYVKYKDCQKLSIFQRLLSCAGCWNSEETQHPVNNEQNNGSGPREDNDNVLESSQDLEQGLPTQSSPTVAVDSPPDNMNDASLTYASWLRPNNTEALGKARIGFRRSYSPPNLEEFVTLLPPKSI